MAKWHKQSKMMAKNHTRKASPGYQVLVLDRGAARIDIPAGWVISPGESCLEVRDKPQPDNRCLIQVRKSSKWTSVACHSRASSRR